MTRIAFGLCATSVALAVAAAPTAAQTKLLRFPDIFGDRVVFSYAGDLWQASATGGTAVRLTAHPGLEMFAKFSPDGKWIAFTGQYDGDEQVYVIPESGGEPRQLTYYPAHGPLTPRWGYDNQVYGWTPDGTRVVFRSMRDGDGGGRVQCALYTVPVGGGLPVKLPMPTSGAGDFSPDGKRMIYSPLFRDFRTWKRYEGGWAQDLYIYDLATNAISPVAHSVRTERDPMWIGSTIYFVSDRDGTLNLYSYDITSQQVEELTHSTVWDVRWASSDNLSKVVYELDGELHVYDTKARKDVKLDITVPDDGINRRPSRYAVAKFVEGFELSPKGERALFVARGDVFTVPIEKGPTRNLTDSSNAHDRAAVWSPDGKNIAFVSDMSGEDQVYLVAQDGGSAPVALTTTNVGQLGNLRWAPDGKHLAVGEQGRQGARGVGGREEDDRGGGRRLRKGDRLRLLHGRPVACILALQLERQQLAVRLGRRRREGAARHRRHLQHRLPRVGSGGRLPVLPFRPRVRTADLERRVELCGQPYDRDLRNGAAAGREEPVPTGVRRGDA